MEKVIEIQHLSKSFGDHKVLSIRKNIDKPGNQETLAASSTISTTSMEVTNVLSYRISPNADSGLFRWKHNGAIEASCFLSTSC